MKAAVYTQYGPPEVLHITEVDKPVPGDHEVLIKIHVSTVSAPDWRMRKADPWVTRLVNGMLKPKRKILGYEFAGVIAATGRDVTLFMPGDAVFGASAGSAGGFAEYACATEKNLALKLQQRHDSFRRLCRISVHARDRHDTAKTR